MAREKEKKDSGTIVFHEFNKDILHSVDSKAPLIKKLALVTALLEHTKTPEKISKSTEEKEVICRSPKVQARK